MVLSFIGAIALAACGGDGNGGAARGATDGSVADAARDQAAPAGDAAAPPADGSADAGSYGTGTLRANVKVLAADEQRTIESMAAGKWVVRGSIAARPGDIWLTDDAAVRIQAVAEEAGRTILSVVPAEIEEVFSRLTLQRDLDMAGAQWVPGTGGAAAPAAPPGKLTPPWSPLLPSPTPWAAGPAVIQAVDEPFEVTATDVLTIAGKQSSLSAGVTATVRGRLTFDYDETNGSSGAVNLAASVEGWVQAQTAGSAEQIAERRLGHLVIPVPFTIADPLLRRLGLRLASIHVPISVGAEASASYGVSVKVTGTLGAGLAATHARDGSFTIPDPTLTGSVTVTGELPGTGPTAAARGSASVGIFLRARPQLLILNKVASVGGDLKAGLYADGEISAFLQAPYYCLLVQGKLKAEVFGMFKAVGISEKKTPTLARSLDLGKPLSAGDCGGVEMGPPAPPANPAGSIGDPHLLTFDRVRYDCQAVGELTLVRSTIDDLEIQVRTKPWGTRTDVAINTAAAAKVAGDVVGFQTDGAVRLNHVPMPFAEGKADLPRGGRLFRRGPQYTLVWPDGSQLRVHVNPQYLDLEVFLANDRRGKVAGLLGNFDGNPQQELVTRGGLVLADPPSFEQLYQSFAESWRIKESLLDYAMGEDTETHTDRSFPRRLATIQTLSDADRQAATAICQAAGVAPEWMESCVMDVAFTGEARFAQGLARAAAAMRTVEVRPPAGGGDGGVGDGPPGGGPGALFQDDFDAYTLGFNVTEFAGNWTVTAGSVDVIGPGHYDLHPGHGRYIDLDGSSGQGGTFVSREVSLAPGNYLVQFSLAGSARSDTNTVEVKLGSLHTESFTRVGSAPFETIVRRVTVPAAQSVRLSFSNPGSDNSGLILDDVSIRPE